MEALQGALDVEKRRVLRTMPTKKIEIPHKEIDITEVIREVYQRIVGFFKNSTENLFFNQLIPSDSKEDKILTFIPLLHLVNEQKVGLRQRKHFGPIEITLRE